MSRKSKRSAKKKTVTDQAGDSSPWLERFSLMHDIPAALMDILAENAVTSEAIFAGLTE